VRNYIDGLEQLITREPEFIDSHAHLSFAFHRQGKPKKALDAALAGVAIGERLIPEGFHGAIEWGYLENRPFLRALHGVVLAYMRLRRHKDAASFIDKMPAYNPNDNQGVRYLLGSEVLRAGDKIRAETVLNENADNYPPYYYELGLLHIMNGDWVKAATALRQGFCANIYLAEILCGHSDPQPLAIWHGSNLAQPDTATDYMKMYGNLWFRHPDSFAFVRWLFNHSSVMAERASLMKCHEALFSGNEYETRKTILSRQQALLNGIDNRLSTEIVKKIKDRHRQEFWPWIQRLGW
jgi:tetratricopeptide (TPR) repeat protein